MSQFGMRVSIGVIMPHIEKHTSDSRYCTQTLTIESTDTNF